MKMCPKKADNGWRLDLEEPNIVTGRVAKCCTYTHTELNIAFLMPCLSVKRHVFASRQRSDFVRALNYCTDQTHLCVYATMNARKLQWGINDDTDRAYIQSDLSLQLCRIQYAGQGRRWHFTFVSRTPHLVYPSFPHSSPTPLVVASGQRNAAGCD